MKFTDLGLSPVILKAISKKGYETPSPIQAEAIPVVLEGRDLMAAAQTGTGKTAGFTLPILNILSKGQGAVKTEVRCLILTPTRELAAQVGESVADYGSGLHLKSNIIFGGVKAGPQISKLRHGSDVLVATPGRLLDLYNQKAISFKNLEIFILDEADRMLDMGFINDIKKIVKSLPTKRQNLMFSATFSNQIRKLAQQFLNNPAEVSVSPKNSTAETVKQLVYPVNKNQKTNLLIHLVEKFNWNQVLVFSRTKHGANKIAQKLVESGINSSAIHGNKSQGARTKALADFKSGRVKVLVATDIAARGLDIDQLPQVVNFDLPNVSEDYVHRIGRTGRAGAQGEAVSFVADDEYEYLKDIEKLINQEIEQIEVSGFEPTHKLGSVVVVKAASKQSQTSGRGRGGSNGPSRGKGGQSSKPGRSGGSSQGGRSGGSSRRSSESNGVVSNDAGSSSRSQSRTGSGRSNQGSSSSDNDSRGSFKWGRR